MIEHNGCVGCKYEQYDESCKECTNCTCNSHDKYMPSENYLDKLKIAELEEEVRQLKKSQIKHAQWKNRYMPATPQGWYCSACGNYAVTWTTFDHNNGLKYKCHTGKFCPHCGARMDEDKE